MDKMSSVRPTSPTWRLGGENSAGPKFEAKLLEAIRDRVAHIGWEPENLDFAQLGQPDLVLRGPGGGLALLELVLGRGDLYFTSIAQIDTLAGVLSHGRDELEVRPFIVTTRNVPQAVQNAATEIGVRLVVDSDATHLADRIVDLLRAPA